MWVARDKKGTLLVFRDFPKRHINEKTWHRPNNSMVLYNEDYPQYQSLKWEDEPIEVKLEVVHQHIKPDEYMDEADMIEMESMGIGCRIDGGFVYN